MADVKVQSLLLVDDNRVDQMIYKRLIERSGLVANLSQAFSGEEALEVLTDAEIKKPDLVLLDINMPGMNGFDFLEIATAKLSRDMCPVFMMLTTSINPIDRTRAEQFPVVKDFFNKPLTLALLDKILKAHARYARD